MKTLIIYAHPYEGSFNNAILKKVEERLKEKGDNYDIIDLNLENFDPVMRKEDLALYSKGGYQDEKVGEYQKKIEKATRLVFIFPIWWGGLPAILKGFIDKVFLKGWAYEKKGIMLVGKLQHIKETLVISTMETPNLIYSLLLKEPMKHMFIKGTLNLIGIKKVKTLSFDMISSANSEKIKKYLNKIEKMI